MVVKLSRIKNYCCCLISDSFIPTLLCVMSRENPSYCPNAYLWYYLICVCFILLVSLLCLFLLIHFASAFYMLVCFIELIVVLCWTLSSIGRLRLYTLCVCITAKIRYRLMNRNLFGCFLLLLFPSCLPLPSYETTKTNTQTKH